MKESDFLIWLASAQKGDSVIYHHGWLPRDTQFDPDLARLRAVVLQASYLGNDFAGKGTFASGLNFLAITQKRREFAGASIAPRDDPVFDYVAQISRVLSHEDRRGLQNWRDAYASKRAS